MDTPSSSPSTINSNDFSHLFPASTAQDTDIPDWLKEHQTHKDWTSDNTFSLPNGTSTYQPHSAYYDHYLTMFEKDESRTLNPQHQVHRLYDVTYEDPSNPEFGSCNQEESRAEPQPSYKQSSVPCVSCTTTSRQDNSSHLADACRCNETIITQLSLLPALLHIERCDFDVELVQLQKAIRLCAGALACTCPGKDDASILSIGMLITHIVSFFERGRARVGRKENDTVSADLAGTITPVRSPKFSVGICQIDGEDEDELKQEIWWLQIKKVESLLSTFKEMVAKISRQDVCQDTAQGPAWENLILLLGQKIQMVKKTWSAYRDRS
ncbi:MAG: hypothetical protein Q9217_003153 [Psora testacea]